MNASDEPLAIQFIRRIGGATKNQKLRLIAEWCRNNDHKLPLDAFDHLIACAEKQDRRPKERKSRVEKVNEKALRFAVPVEELVSQGKGVVEARRTVAEEKYASYKTVERNHLDYQRCNRVTDKQMCKTATSIASTVSTLQATLPITKGEAIEITSERLYYSCETIQYLLDLKQKSTTSN